MAGRGWYPAALCTEDLECRDELVAVVERLPRGVRHAVAEALRELDSRYRALTLDDAGRALSVALSVELAVLAARPWYWRRRPRCLPWEGSQ
ncbi:hypothetical protein [Streptomyces mexicanus]|uniref:Uncharacterized protein n=1 Tax=Streptomyces mexicanus TaxID=178566 RepID=A0A7X1HV36_9ACTN|nr:hypothetical protein [Streptomyces mexicanus]MBC2863669.1 hypothetical protein [Streptomyces mexicanus]